MNLCNVVVNDINSENVNLVAEEIEALGRRSIAIVADVSVGKEVYSMVDHVVEKFGKLDVMVANTGIAQVKQAIELTWDKVFAINVKGFFLCAQAAAKQMIKQKKEK